MKTFAIAFTVMAAFGSMTFGATAFADGFKCEGLTYGTKIDVYHKLKPSEGTRNASIMIVSNPSLKRGEQTIATFTQEQKILIQKGATYIATVDGRYQTVKNGGKQIADTVLGELQTIELVVNFNYVTNTPSQLGQKYSALINYEKENGSTTSENAICIRYKKN